MQLFIWAITNKNYLITVVGIAWSKNPPPSGEIFDKQNKNVQRVSNTWTFWSFEYVFINLPWDKNSIKLLWLITRSIDVAHFHATLRTRRKKTLPHQSQSKNILNDTASRFMKNIDDNFRLTDILVFFMPYKYFTWPHF